MLVDTTDLRRSEALSNLLIHKAKFSLDGGEEILAANQIMVWVSQLHKRIQADLQPPIPADIPQVPAPEIQISKSGKKK